MKPVIRLCAALFAGFLLFAAQAPTPPATPRPANAPSLLVVIVIDQFRADYVDWYGGQWSKGLKRLLDKGAVFSNAAYPYAATFTCAGHATIATGAFPATHGMSSNDFYDRALRRLVACAFDPRATSVPFGGVAGKEHLSGRSLLIPTFIEELRRQSSAPTRTVSVGQKPRTATTFAGQGGSPDSVAVFAEADGTWATSDVYAGTPWPDVDDFVRAHPAKADYGTIWQLLLPPSSYRFVDDGAGENRPAPWTRTFPHPLISTKGVPDAEFVTAWGRSPWDDAFLTDLAIHLLKTRKLGAGQGTDVLTLALPSVDEIGHEFGPRSFEVQDVLARVDVNVGRLLDALDEQIGPHYVVALSSDHGVALIPEQVTAEGGDAGRIISADLRTAVNSSIEQVFGAPGTYVAAVFDTQIALTPGVFDQLRQKRDGIRIVKDAIRAYRGIAEVYSSDDVIGGDLTDPGLRAWKLSYVPGRSGDFLLTPKPNWMIRANTGATHGTRNTYDQRVPLMFYGLQIRSGHYEAAVTPADLAPTLMELAGRKLPRAQGRPLVEAIVR